MFTSPGLSAQLGALFTRDLLSSRLISVEQARSFERPPSALAKLKLALGKVFEDQL